jgi:DNA-binding transcriptional MerR regulator|nr:helix-turn-helix domain-containing protein [uncultured Dongia sp.]
MAMNKIGLSIGDLARKTGSNAQTIRYYETIGLMPEPDRSQGNQRVYAQAHAERLSFIRHSRELGFPLEAIRELLKLSDDPDQSCASADKIAQQQLAEVESRIERLTSLKQELERMITQCHMGKIGSCNVIQVLANHSNCLSTSHSAGHSAFGEGIQLSDTQRTHR